MGMLEYIPATRRILRHLSLDPQDFAAEHGVGLHELSQSVAQHSLTFMRTFSLETPADWFGYLVVEGESQQMAGTCSFKGPPIDHAVEIAYFTFPGFEARGIGTAMARFLVDRVASSGSRGGDCAHPARVQRSHAHFGKARNDVDGDGGQRG